MKHSARAREGRSPNCTRSRSIISRASSSVIKRVPFVRWKHRLNTELSQQSNAANPSIISDDAAFAIAAIEMSCYEAIGLFVLGDVGVQQVESHPPNVSAPRAREHDPAANFHLNQQRLVMIVFHQTNRQLSRAGFAIRLVLPTVAAQALPKITKPVIQTDRNQRQVQVAGGFQVIAGQYSQPTGIERQRIVDPIFSAEILPRFALIAEVRWRVRDTQGHSCTRKLR